MENRVGIRLEILAKLRIIGKRCFDWARIC